jgi:hypothetical protein
MNVARVVEASLRRFQCAYDGYVESPFPLGSLIAVEEGVAPIFGVVAEVESGPDDPTRPLSPPSDGGVLTAEALLRERPHLRPLLRTRVTIVTCGYAEGEVIWSRLPPSPPPLLAMAAQASADQTVRLVSDGGFLSALVASTECDDAVIAAAIRRASIAFELESRDFKIRAGKELARLLKAEPARLASIIRGVAP